MESNLEQKIAALEAKVDATYQAVEKMRKYMQLAAWITIAAVVLPLIGLIFIIPFFISSYTSALGGL